MCSEAHARLVVWSAPIIAPGYQRLRFVPQPCQMQESATVNTSDSRLSTLTLPRPVKPQLGSEITQPLS